MESVIDERTQLFKEGFFRLEFSESQQHFHLNRGTYAEYTYGWTTICQVGEDLYLSKFIDYMQWRYKFGKKKPIKATTVAKEFESYKWIVESTKRYR